MADYEALLNGDPADRITVTIAGRTFQAGRRTAAHLVRTHERFAKAFPELELVIAQTCYHTGYAPSAGTHDKDGVLDWYVRTKSGAVASESDHWRVQRWMRNQGWGCWFRHTGDWAALGDWHIHGISLGCPGPVGYYVPGQIDDYHLHTYGLAGQHNADMDKSAFPGDEGPPPWPVGTPAQWRAAIDATVFDYPAWKEEHEMNTQQDAALKQVANDTAAIRRMLTNSAARDKKRHDAIKAALDDLANEVSDDATKAQVAKAQSRILDALTKDDTEDTNPGL